MKTKNIFSVLSLALIFCTAISVSAGKPVKTDIQGLGMLVTHHVNVILASEKPLCNTYLVQIVNQNGQLVAPAKAYVPGVSSYNFYERGPATGIRYAVLVRSMNGSFICENELFTKPAMVKGPFDPGVVYRYDLFPQLTSPKE
jgi:hypothetical protein